MAPLNEEEALAAFGVTREEVEALPGTAAMRAARAEMDHLEVVVLPRRVAEVEAHLSATLPEGLSLRFLPVPTGVVTVCCGTHLPAGCCDPEDCGPCCAECPTCPTLARART